jgi:hypothetical protein
MFGGSDMRIVMTICRWLSSFLISLVVSVVAFACISLAYELFHLQERIGVDDDVCWLALLIGPALIVFIHRAFHGRVWVPVSALLGGVVLAGFGIFLFLSAREADAHHVPSGPLSGIGNVFGMIPGLFLGVLAAFAVCGAILALVARRIGRSAEPITGANAG